MPNAVASNRMIYSYNVVPPTVSYEMYTIPDQMDIYYNNVLVATTGRLVSGAAYLYQV